MYFAHSANKAGSSSEPLKEHILCVAKRASEYGEVFDAKQEALIAGLWHDLGKYSDLFTRRLNGEVSGLDHWTPGAVAALHIFREKAIAAALAIQGHHVGLQEGFGPAIHSSLSNPEMSARMTVTELDPRVVVDRFLEDGFVCPSPPVASLYDFNTQPVAAMLDARMLFSALVDSDFIETEAHFEGMRDGTKVYRQAGQLLQAEQALTIITEHLTELEGKNVASKNVSNMRRDLLDACLSSASKPKGIFTLTAPTGAGKTLSMLAFAMKHAKLHSEIRRVIMVVPFLSIIEQTTNVYRRLLDKVFGAQYVLEHHSLADVRSKDEDIRNCDNEEEARRTARFLTENWDAPLVLTTSVQFFESLFANRPARCRKLHRLAKSIILFDEVQTLPPRIAVPSLAALSRLVERYGCTVVFSTATQPAFDHLHDKVKLFAGMGWRPQAIVEEPRQIFNQARRVRIDWQIKQRRSWESLADELSLNENSRSLCIVNLKRHAKQLVNGLRDRLGASGLYHLSTNMCPAHRENVLTDVRKRLDSSALPPCRLVSTQCIEAGVDMDFPAAWRAFAPLDAIAQAAGRCNREGKLSGEGRMVVFLPEKKSSRDYLYPPGGYKEATETTETLFKMKENEALEKGIPLEDAFDIYDPELFNLYYRLLYDLTATTDLPRDLEDAIHRRSFIDAAQHYHVIPQTSINVLVPYMDVPAQNSTGKSLFDSLNERLTKDARLTRAWIVDAKPLTISIYRPGKADAVWQFLEPAPLGRGEKADDWYIYVNPDDYDPLLGLNPLNTVDEWSV